MAKKTTNGALSQPDEGPFPKFGVEVPAGEYGDESVDVVVRRYIDVDVNLSAGQSLRLTAVAARTLAASLLAAADDLDGGAR